MDQLETLALRVFKLAESVREGKVDPLDLKLTPEYKELQAMVAEVDKRLDIDELLNEILAAKISRVQELAKVLASPELYVNRLKGTKARELAKMMSYHHPMRVAHLDHEPLNRAFDRVSRFIDALSASPPEDNAPDTAGLPESYRFPTEDAVLLEDAELFGARIPKGQTVSLDELLNSESFDEFLRRFLYVVILVSRGVIEYDGSSRTVVRADSSEREEVDAS
ncbi:MAG: hypothetical protein ACE5H4_11235 [Candidatus Thorarchaeota archaeon]